MLAQYAPSIRNNRWVWNIAVKLSTYINTKDKTILIFNRFNMSKDTSNGSGSSSTAHYSTAAFNLFTERSFTRYIKRI